MWRAAARQHRGRHFGGGFAVGTEAFDVIVERCFHVQQRPGDIEQQLFVRCAHAAGDFFQHATLFVDHAARHAQGEHAQRVAHAFEHFGLAGQLRGIGVGLAQEQVERFFHPQQVVLQRLGHGVQQRAVMARHRTACVFDLARFRQQRIE